MSELKEHHSYFDDEDRLVTVYKVKDVVWSEIENE